MTSPAGGAPSDACRAAVQGTLYGMVMCEYVSAVSDEAAVGVLEAPGGPDPSVFDVLSLKARSGQLSENPDSAVRSGS